MTGVAFPFVAAASGSPIPVGSGAVVQIVGAALTVAGAVMAAWVGGKFSTRASRETMAVESRRVDDAWVKDMLAQHRDEIGRLRDDRDEDRRELTGMKERLAATTLALNAAVSYIQRLLTDRAEVLPGRPAPPPPVELHAHLGEAVLDDWRTPPHPGPGG